MSDDLPAPMVPPECDLRGMPYMPLDLMRLFDSDLYALSTGDEFKAALTLWGKAFLQVPAGSLPDDDRVLAHLSGAGVKWKKVRGMALRGFVKCMDGRLYHPTLSEKVRDAWQARLAQRDRTEKARAARGALRQTTQNQHAPSVTSSVTETVTMSVTDTVTTNVTDSVTGSKGREGKGREEKNLSHTVESRTGARASPQTLGSDPPKTERAALAARVAAALGVKSLGDLPPNCAGSLMAEVESCLAQGCDFVADLAPALAKRPNGNWPGNARYWGQIALGNRDRRLSNPAAARSTVPAQINQQDRDMRAHAWLRKQAWADSWGPREGEAGCCISPDEWATYRAEHERRAA